MRNVGGSLLNAVPNLIPGKGASGRDLKTGFQIAQTLCRLQRPDIGVSVGRKGISVIGNGQTLRVPHEFSPTQAAERALEVIV